MINTWMITLAMVAAMTTLLINGNDQTGTSLQRSSRKLEKKKLQRKEKGENKMKNLRENLKKIVKTIVKNYVESMKMYGEALLRGGSYGCV